MEIVNIQNAKTHLSRLVEEVLGGSDIVIAKGGKPLVKLVPFQKDQSKRKLGSLAGQASEADDCWAADPNLEAAFYGEGSPVLKVAETQP